MRAEEKRKNKTGSKHLLAIINPKLIKEFIETVAYIRNYCRYNFNTF